MITVVLDVNILASAALNAHGLPARVLDLAADGRYALAVSTHILEKLAEVLERPYFATNLSAGSRARILRALDDNRIPFQPDESVRGIAADLEDDLVLGTAVAAHADFLVTGDKALLAIGEFRGVRIVDASRFLEELGEQ